MLSSFQHDSLTTINKVSYFDMPETLAEQNEMPWKQFVDALQTPVMVLNTDLVFCYANASYCQLVSKSSEELLGHHVFKVFPEADYIIEEMRGIFNTALTGETVIVGEQPYKLMNAEGVMEENYWRIVNRPIRDKHGSVQYILQEADNITIERDMERQRDIISNELDHRVKNLLAVLNAIISLSGSNSDTVQEFRKALADRFQAISKSHERLAKSDWNGLDLHDVLHDTLEPFCDLNTDKVSMHGPPLNLAVRATRDASMLFHEFATNAAKYGFLSHRDGRLNVSWTVNPETRIAELVWTESGLIGIEEPTHTGFGSILSTSFPNMKVTKQFKPDGIEIKIAVSEDILARSQ